MLLHRTAAEPKRKALRRGPEPSLMTQSSRHEKADLRDLHAQYHECYSHLRAHMKAVWQVPTTVSIAGGLVLAAFQFARTLIVREAVLILAALLTFTMYVALTKHEFYYDIEEKTLGVLEDQMHLKRIQRRSKAQTGVEYWHLTEESQVGFFERWSANQTFKWVMIPILILFVVLIVFAAVYDP